MALRAAAAAAIGGTGWTWAIALLAMKEHLTLNYFVLAPMPPVWGCLGLSASRLFLVLGAGLLVTVACGNAVRRTGRFWAPAACWLMCSWSIPALDMLRLAGVSIPSTFLEPLLLAAVTGAAAGAIAETFKATPKGTVPFSPTRKLGPSPWLAVVWLLAILCCGWWYYEGQQAYDNYLLGYYDFAQLGRRIVNTWEGRGFLLDPKTLPAFWDHFNPGIALLAPLWGLWPDARLFIFIQAACLALSAPLVNAIARRLGADSPTSACWAAAYLAFPAVGQLNLSCSYGWHPVTLALPLIFLAVWALLEGRRTLAFSAAVLACSFEESVLLVLACLAITLAFQAWRSRRARRPSSESSYLLADSLPLWGWLAVAALLGLGFAAILGVTPLAKYQTSRFADLGGSIPEIILSPVARPAVFWSILFRPCCGYFLLCLAIPLGLRSLLRGWPVLLATAIPFGVLLAWNRDSAASIAFWYTTLLIPILFLAAMTGSAIGTQDGNRSWGLQRAGVTALAACATASAAFGSLPWSSPTLGGVVAVTYSAPGVAENRLVGSPGNAFLNQVVSKTGGRESAVLATGRIASHLLAVRRLDTVSQACSRWKALEKEIGAGRSPIELFDWVVLDANEGFYQSPEEMRFVADAAKLAKYQLVELEHGIAVFARPSVAASWHGSRAKPD